MQTKTTATLLALAVAGLAGNASAATQVTSDVTVSQTWGGASATPPNLPCTLADPIVLENPIFVKGGATLTILPGCVVRGQPRTAAVTAGSTVGTPGTLIVTQDGRIVANGNATNPITMTTAAVDNDDDGIADDVKDILGNPGADGFLDKWVPGDIFLDDTPTTAPLAPLNKAGFGNLQLWGGLVLLGEAPTNLGDACGVGLGKCTVEGLTVPGFPAADATYGGLEPHDNSGSLRFVSVRHAGDQIGADNELNGITLAGIGDGTVVENVEVYVNFDDGIEWFGGTVNGKNLHVAFAGDDTFDLDEGYTGRNQFLYGIMPFFNNNDGTAFGSGSGDKGGEWDGDNFGEVVSNANVQSDGSCRPLTYPEMYNLTLHGSTLLATRDFTPVSTASANRGIQMRNGFAGELLNAIIVNTGTQKALDVDGAATGCPGFDVDPDNIAACRVAVLASTFDNSAALAADELAVLACGDADFRTPTASSNNTVNVAAFPNLVKEDTSFDPTGNAAGKLVASLKASPINPKLNAGLTGTGGAVPGPTVVTFRGAFDRLVPGLWTDGWTALSQGGLLSAP